MARNPDHLRNTITFAGEPAIVQPAPAPATPKPKAERWIDFSAIAKWLDEQAVRLGVAAAPDEPFQTASFDMTHFWRQLVDGCAVMSPAKVSHWLEIGVHEGGSAVYTIDRMRPGSVFVGVDCWSDAHYPLAKQMAFQNVYSAARRRGIHAVLLDGTVQQHQRKLANIAPSGFDGIYHDGSKDYHEVLAVSRVLWPMLKSGGGFAWDDAHWFHDEWKVDMSRLSPAGKAQRDFWLNVP